MSSPCRSGEFCFVLNFLAGFRYYAETFDFGFELSPLIRIVFFMGMAYLVSAILFYFGTQRGYEGTPSNMTVVAPTAKGP